MKKYGKYEKRPEGVPAKQPKVKSALLQTYLTSLLCMVLCVTMFFGTSYAWFTSEVTNEGNEIYVGTLKVGLYKLKNGSPVSLASSDTNKETLFNGDIRWEPGYTSLETIQVVNEGDLAFKYVLNFTSDDADVEAVADSFEVWVFNHYQKTYEAPGSYDEMIGNEDWVKVGTLADVLNGKAVLEDRNMYTVRRSDEGADPTAPTNKGTTDGVPTTDTYTIALHMKEETSDANLMGKKITLNVKLVAYQKGSEQDAFGDAYDNKQFVSTEKEFISAMENPDGGVVVLMNDISLTKGTNIYGDVVLDLNGHNIEDVTEDSVGVMLYAQAGAKLTITGDGKVYSEDHNKFILAAAKDSEIIVNGGNFAKAPYTWGEECGYAGCKGNAGTKHNDSHTGNAQHLGPIIWSAGVITVYDGYFDCGILNPASVEANSRPVVHDCMYPTINLSAGAGSGHLFIYGGTFVTANPVNGDDNPNGLNGADNSEGNLNATEKAFFLYGQKEYGVLPKGYTVLEGTTEDGRTTYTYSYKAPTSAVENG